MQQFTFIVIGLAYMTSYVYTSKTLHRVNYIVSEGNQTEVKFHFPLANVPVVLQIGSRSPFYKNGKIQTGGLSEDQQNRFQVREMHENGLLVVVKIKNVSRHDAGAYIALEREESSTRSQRKSLIVEYPPGIPSCRYDLSSNSNVDIISETWDVIECTANVGNIPGYIVCFQNGQPLPPESKPTQNKLTLSQKIWVKTHQEVLCCSSGYKDPFKAKATHCTEFQTVQEREITTLRDTLTLSRNPDPEGALSPERITLSSTKMPTTVEESSSTSLHWPWTDIHNTALLYFIALVILIDNFVWIFVNNSRKNK